MPTFIDSQCDLPLFAAARRGDPPTSKAAGRASRAFAGGHCQKILDALSVEPGTKDEIGARCGLTEQQVIRRMSKLEADGKVVAIGEATSPSGCMETVWGRADR